jgi:hypothetical protein
MRKQTFPFLSVMAGSVMSFVALTTPPALANTTTILELPVHFTTAEGSNVVLDAGAYTVEAADEWLRVTPGEGQAVDAILLEAQAAVHEEDLSDPLALSAPGEQGDTHHLALLLPDGKRLEAVGSYSGIRSRSTLPLLTIQRVRTLSSSQSAASTEFITPLIGGGGGNRSYNIDCGNGSVLVGAIYKAGMWLDAIGIICQRVNPQTGALGEEFTRGPVGGGGGQARIARCRIGDVVQGIRGLTGQFVHQLHMRCSRWEPQRKAPVYSEICNPNTPACLVFGGVGGSRSDLFFCPAGKVGKAFRGKFGLYVDSTRFVCDEWDK